MAQYDGSIRINTQINTQNASSQLMSLENRIVKTADKIASLRSKMDALKDAKIPTQEYKNISAQIQKAELEFNKLLEKQEQMQREGKNNGVAWDKLNTKMDEVGNTIQYAKGELQELIDTGKAFTLGSGTQEYTNLGQQLEYIENDYSTLIQRRNEFMQRHNIQAGGYERLKAALEELQGKITRIIHPIESMKSSFASMTASIKERVAGIAASIINGIVHPFQTMKNIASKTIGSTSKLLSNMASAAKKAGNAIAKVASSMSMFGKSAKKSNNMLQYGFRSILKYGLGIRSLYALINKFRTAVKEGFGNLAQYSESVNTALSSLKSALTQLKNSLATAFAPILTAIAPALTTLINLVSKAATAVGMLIAALTGQKMFTKATAVQEKYADSLSGTAKSAKSANKQLSSLDKLNNLTSGNTGGGGGAGSGISAEDMFEDVQIDDRFKHIVQWLKSMWENADFTELGTVIGAKIKNGLDSIDWSPIKATAQKIGKSIGTLINGFVEVGGLGASIGKTIGEAINTGIAGINAFLDNTHWDSVGIFIGEGLNGIVNTVDWEGIGHLFAAKWNAIFETIGNIATTFDWSNFGLQLATSVNTFITDFDWAENGARLGELAKGLLDSIISFLENTDWQALGNGIADFISNIDWSGVLERLAEGIGAALGGLATLLWELIEDAWNSVVDWWEETAFEDGEFTITGLLDGILEGIKGIGTWIYEHIFKPFVDGFKKAFDINSPSKVMEEMGTYIIQGLLDGISSLVENVTNTWESMKKTAVETWKSVQESLADTWENIKTYAGDKWDSIKENLSGVWDSMRSTVENVWDSISSKITGEIDVIKDKIDEFIGKVRDAIQSVKDFFSSGFDKVGSAVSGFFSGDSGSNANTYSMRAISSPYAANPAFSTLNTAPIPKLATGAVIPANREFLAVLGDQKHGTNIEAPLDTIKDANKEAFLEVLSKLGVTGNSGRNSGEERFVFQIDGNTFFEITRKYAREYFNRTGRSPYPI